MAENSLSIQKFVEIGRNVQKLQTKFPWTPLEQLYTMDLTIFIVMA
jgi:hypothetical protein